MTVDVPLYEQIYNDIFNCIKSGTLKPNDRVPSEKELADQYKVSRITSKKALEKLAQTGVIERIRGKGSFVATSLPDLTTLKQPAMLDDADDADDDCEETSRLFGVILPDFFSEWYGKNLLRSIEKRCSEMKYNLIIKLTYGNQDEEEKAISSLLQQGVEGIMVFPVSGQHYNVNILRLVLDGFPLVVIDRYLKGIPACAVLTDNKAAATDLTEYLLNQGHRDIAFVSPPEEFTSSIEERLQGYTSALVQRGVRLNPQYQLTELFSTLINFQQGDELEEDKIKLKQFIEQNPQLTAFVACEYEIAMVIAQVIRSFGKQIPEDYTIACFDYPDRHFEEHSFTHIKQDETKMGKKAVDLLIGQIKGQSVDAKNMIDYSLIAGKNNNSVFSK